MSKLDALLLHPDPQLRQALRAALHESHIVRVLGEAAGGDEALELLQAVGHGVCFLGVDIEASQDGFAVAPRIARLPQRPAIIFVAGDEAHAFQALELGATDYLRWPCLPERLAITFERLAQFKARHRLIPPPQERWEDANPEPALQAASHIQPLSSAPLTEEDDESTLQLPLGDDEEDRFLSALQQAWDHQEQAPAGPPMDLEKLPISIDGRTILLPYRQIIFVEAVEDYTYVHTNSQKFLTNYRLKHLEERLQKHRFFRVHRKYLVNLEMVTEIASLPGSTFMLRTAGKTRIELPISRRRVGNLKAMLGL